jgi:hypothetical protein
MRVTAEGRDSALDVGLRTGPEQTRLNADRESGRRAETQSRRPRLDFGINRDGANAPLIGALRSCTCHADRSTFMTRDERIALRHLIEAAQRFLERTKGDFADTDQWQELTRAMTRSRHEIQGASDRSSLVRVGLLGSTRRGGGPYFAGSRSGSASARFAASISAAFFSTSATRWSTMSASFRRWSVRPLI